MKQSLLIVLSLIILSSCKKTEEKPELLTIYEECNVDGTIAKEEDILPPFEAPTRTDPKVLVVLYHNLVYGRTGNIYNRDIYSFEHDLIYLRKNFKVIDFDQLNLINQGQMTLTQDAVIITFDDADLSIYPLAFPLLRKYDLKATFFVVSSYIGGINYTTWDQLHEIASYVNPSSQKIFTIGSHSATHALLGELTMDEVAVELETSKRIIESNLDVSVDYVALPYGSGADNPLIQAKAKELGYKGLRNSVPNAITTLPINMYNIPCYNVENYSNDVFVVNINTLLKR